MRLDEPKFLDTSVAPIVADMVARYEAATGKTLQPAQPERLLINVFAYREALLRQSFQQGAMQNLLAFAQGVMVDYLGELVGVARLEPQAAHTPLQFTLTTPQAFGVVIPSGTRAESKDGKVLFETVGPLTIPAGETVGVVDGVAQLEGIVGNGYLPGEVATLLDPVANVAGVGNTITSAGGFDAESDERMKERIRLAPESFSTAGSKGAYRLHVLSAHPSIVDVNIQRGSSGEVLIFPLVDSGDPSQAVLDLVEATLSDEKVRPISDTVNVQAPTRVDFSIVANVTLFSDADQDFVVSTIASRLAAYTVMLRVKLGRDPVPSQIIGVAATVEGVYEVSLPSPALIAIPSNAYANCTNVTINVVGVTNG